MSYFDEMLSGATHNPPNLTKANITEENIYSLSNFT